MQYLRLQSVALRELSKTRQQGRTSTLWEIIDRSTSEPRGHRQNHFEALSAGVMSVRPQKIENPSTHHPNLSKYYMKSIPIFDSIGVAYMVLESLLTPRGVSADTIWRLWTQRRYM